MWSLSIAALVIIIAIGVGLGIGFGIAYWKNSLRRFQKTTTNSHTAEEPFHCVHIICTKDSCQFALNIAYSPYLSDEAPILPVENCTAEKCTCRYKHHKDRRSNEDRRFYFESYDEWLRSPTNERRSQADRRATLTIHS